MKKKLNYSTVFVFYEYNFSILWVYIQYGVSMYMSIHLIEYLLSIIRMCMDYAMNTQNYFNFVLA